MRESPQELEFSITYHQIQGEHILIQHAPTGSTVVFRAPLDTIDPCTMWRIRVIWTVVAGLLSIFGVTAGLTERVTQYIKQRILGNQALMTLVAQSLNVQVIGAIGAIGIFRSLQVLQEFGVLWPLIMLGLTTLGWWALGRLLVWLLTKVFGGPAAVLETISNLVVAAAQVVYVFTQQPSGCPLLPGGEGQERVCGT